MVMINRCTFLYSGLFKYHFDFLEVFTQLLLGTSRPHILLVEQRFLHFRDQHSVLFALEHFGSFLPHRLFLQMVLDGFAFDHDFLMLCRHFLHLLFSICFELRVRHPTSNYSQSLLPEFQLLLLRRLHSVLRLFLIDRLVDVRMEGGVLSDLMIRSLFSLITLFMNRLIIKFWLLLFGFLPEKLMQRLLLLTFIHNRFHFLFLRFHYHNLFIL